MKATPEAALVLLSGGQDSTTCLAWALKHFRRVEAATIDYGQRHRVELEAAAAIARAAGVAQRVIPCDSFRALGGNALTGDEAVAPGVRAANQLPNTFVPGRNLIFLSLAAAWAYQLGISELVTGVCQTDSSGYPDCLADTMDALQQALRCGMDAPFTIHTPLMHLTKAQTVAMLRDLGGLHLLALSHTCYNGQRPPCGICPACVLRAKGFDEARIADPLIATTPPRH
ncbi:MAG: 7-cyano-7-deazaguanine synthase QueC [Planctomycetes bacterium]|nr:7-cyano-7-deazaguanine synthase QueC [Planctomycetota bacterium]